MNDPRVSMVEEDKVRYLANTPNDPYYSSQWSLPNIQATEAWQQIGTLNKSIKVAVIDTGVDADHPDLAGRIASGGKGFNYSISSNNSVASDDFNDVLGHGTMVAGVIVANTHNSIGVAGVSGNLDVKILPIKVFWGSDPLKATCYTSDIIAAIDYAISQGVDVINMSLGAIGYIEAENLAVQRAINAGITVVASAGNDGNTSDAGKYEYPASYNNVISVGSINSSNAKSVFSSYNDKVSVVAPGEGIVTTEKNSGYSYPSAVNGTSFSAPVVSAIAAVLKGENPSAAPSQIKTTIQSSAIDLGTVGYDVYYGYGKVNFLNAVTSPLVEDGSTGIIDSVILDVYSKKIFMPMAGVSDIIGYADVLSKENVQDSVYQKVYQYLKANHQTPLIFGISSGTKTMVMDGENGYAMYYYLTPTVADAMQATLAVSESVYNACYTFHGLDAGGNGILMPIAVSLSSIAGVVVETGTDVNSAVYHNVYLPFAGVQAQFPIISSANTMTIQISGSANIVYEAVYSTGLPLDEVTNGWAAYCISGVTREQVMQGIVKVR